MSLVKVAVLLTMSIWGVQAVRDFSQEQKLLLAGGEQNETCTKEQTSPPRFADGIPEIIKLEGYEPFSISNIIGFGHFGVVFKTMTIPKK
mmetsp:Transcript_86931/g.150046  ORF Transcript_86931/g.150046 Transcript_86931/m.150046 type:complete len:90 (+) Transcript_86931:62-331(+)